MEWIPIDDDQCPINGEFLLVSFSNYPVPTIAEYRKEEDEDGGSFYLANGTDIKFLDIDLFVNAWMPLPDPFREEAL